jgi:hypothetical protein
MTKPTLPQAHPSDQLAGRTRTCATRTSVRGLRPSLHASADLTAPLLRSLPGGCVTYREEQRGVQGAPENRSMAGRIQHREVRFQKKGS